MVDVRDNRIFAIMAQLAECLCAKIAENELPDVCFCGVLAGAIAYDAMGIGDSCSDEHDDDDEESGHGGQAWVRLVTAYPASQVGVADNQPGNCAKGLGIDIEIGITRPFPIEEQGGVMPDEDLLEAAMLHFADIVTMQQAVSCCDAFDDSDAIMGQFLPVGPEGGVLGGVWPISVLLT